MLHMVGLNVQQAELEVGNFRTRILILILILIFVRSFFWPLILQQIYVNYILRYLTDIQTWHIFSQCCTQNFLAIIFFVKVYI